MIYAVTMSSTLRVRANLKPLLRAESNNEDADTILFSITCDRVAVLDLGRLIACDTPDAIKAHEGAQAAYLGASLGEAA